MYRTLGTQPFRIDAIQTFHAFGVNTMSDQIQLQDSDSFQRLRDIVQSGNCILFLGAGVAIDSGAPSGKTMAKELSQAYFPQRTGQRGLEFGRRSH